MKIIETSFKRSSAHIATLSALDPAADHRRPMTLSETPGHTQANLGQSLVGYCSFLLGPGAQKALSVTSKSLFSQSCVSSGSSIVGLMVTSSKRTYAIPRAPVPAADHC